MQKPTAVFIGTRAEALQALKVVTDVTKIICIENSRAHLLCIENKWPVTVITPKDRKVALEEISKISTHILLSAGFPWIIDEDTLNSTQAIKLNSHPSLLPKFPGKNAIKDAFGQNSSRTGVTVHHITNDVDGGPIIASEEVNIENLSLDEIYQILFGIIEPRVIDKSLKLVIPHLKGVN
jgi:folate-dependent phosphoribosylglycinamide formyltransferase PurN